MNRRSFFITFAVGFVFAIGLGLSGMTQPKKVVDFLDVFGPWDPSLAFVMMGAIGFHGIFYRIIMKKEAPLFTKKFLVPGKREITWQLVVGSALFGIGWGLAGYCPGPAITSLTSSDFRPVAFVLAMIFGMLAVRPLTKKF